MSIQLTQEDFVFTEEDAAALKKIKEAHPAFRANVISFIYTTLLAHTEVTFPTISCYAQEDSEVGYTSNNHWEKLTQLQDINQPFLLKVGDGKTAHIGVALYFKKKLHYLDPNPRACVFTIKRIEKWAAPPPGYTSHPMNDNVGLLQMAAEISDAVGAFINKLINTRLSICDIRMLLSNITFGAAEMVGQAFRLPARGLIGTARCRRERVLRPAPLKKYNTEDSTLRVKALKQSRRRQLSPYQKSKLGHKRVVIPVTTHFTGFASSGESYFVGGICACGALFIIDRHIEYMNTFGQFTNILELVDYIQEQVKEYGFDERFSKKEIKIFMDIAKNVLFPMRCPQPIARASSAPARLVSVPDATPMLEFPSEGGPILSGVPFSQLPVAVAVPGQPVPPGQFATIGTVTPLPNPFDVIVDEMDDAVILDQHSGLQNPQGVSVEGTTPDDEGGRRTRRRKKRKSRRRRRRRKTRRRGKKLK